MNFVQDNEIINDVQSTRHSDEKNMKPSCITSYPGLFEKALRECDLQTIDKTMKNNGEKTDLKECGILESVGLLDDESEKENKNIKKGILFLDSPDYMMFIKNLLQLLDNNINNDNTVNNADNDAICDTINNNEFLNVNNVNNESSFLNINTMNNVLETNNENKVANTSDEKLVIELMNLIGKSDFEDKSGLTNNELINSKPKLQSVNSCLVSKSNEHFINKEDDDSDILIQILKNKVKEYFDLNNNNNNNNDVEENHEFNVKYEIASISNILKKLSDAGNEKNDSFNLFCNDLLSKNNDVQEEILYIRNEFEPSKLINNKILVNAINIAKIKTNGEQAKVIINLKPDTLGKVTLKIITENNNVTAKILTENYHVKEIIESNFQSLKDSLEKQGLIVQDLSVSVNNNANDNNLLSKEEDRLNIVAKKRKITENRLVCNYVDSNEYKKGVVFYDWPYCTINLEA